MNHILIIFISLLFSAFFSGMEIAFITANKLKIALDKKQGYPASRVISFFTDNSGQYIATMLVGNNVALVIYGIFMAIILEPVIKNFITSEVTILFIQTIISTLLILITAEFLPKTIFRINPNFALKIFSFPLLVFFIVLFPFTWIILKFSDFVFKIVLHAEKEEPSNKNVVFEKVDLANLINEASVETKEERKEAPPEIKLFQNALVFSKVKVRDCMIPRTDIVAFEIDGDTREIREKFIESGFSKILIYDDNIDNIIGFISSKDFFQDTEDLRSILNPVSIVPETMPANRLLRKFIQEHKSIAVVVDEFGGTSGMLTIEDIIEEIFGEIQDEHDLVEFVDKQLNEKEFIFSGRLEIQYLNEKYTLKIPDSEEYDTLAGFIFYHYDSIPKVNEIIIIENFEFRILKMENTRLELVRLKILRE